MLMGGIKPEQQQQQQQQQQVVEDDSTSDDVEAELARLAKPKKPLNMKVNP